MFFIAFLFAVIFIFRVRDKPHISPETAPIFEFTGQEGKEEFPFDVKANITYALTGMEDLASMTVAPFIKKQEPLYGFPPRFMFRAGKNVSLTLTYREPKEGMFRKVSEPKESTHSAVYLGTRPDIPLLLYVTPQRYVTSFEVSKGMRLIIEYAGKGYEIGYFKDGVKIHEEINEKGLRKELNFFESSRLKFRAQDTRFLLRINQPPSYPPLFVNNLETREHVIYLEAGQTKRLQSFPIESRTWVSFGEDLNNEVEVTVEDELQHYSIKGWFINRDGILHITAKKRLIISSIHISPR